MASHTRLIGRAGAATGLLGLVLMGGPAWAVDLPTPAPAPAPVAPVTVAPVTVAPVTVAPVTQALAAPVAGLLPDPVATLVPDPVRSLLPAPVASAATTAEDQVPVGSKPQAPAKPATVPAAKSRPAAAAAAPPRQQAQSSTALSPLAATEAFGGAHAALAALPGTVSAPVLAAPMPVTPQLAPAASSVAGPASVPAIPTSEGLPALVIALAIGAVAAAGAGQVAEMGARREAAS
jgi:hypothetical protein